MGLAIVQRIARFHGGVVEFDSRPGKGTEFRLSLPESSSLAEGAISAPVESGLSVADHTVLLVEDDPGILELTRHLLQTQGIRVLSAETGEAAWKLWETHRDDVHLLFTDIVLPGALSGRDLALKILNDKPSLPVLYTSGYSSVGNDQSYFTQDNFLSKPFRPDALQAAVKSALAGSLFPE